MERDHGGDALVQMFARINMEYDPAKRRVRIATLRLDRVTEAYVVRPADCGVLDIYGAQGVYLEQERTSDEAPDFGREPLACFCSDERCRALPKAPSITPTAYRKAPADGEYKQSAHWRWNPTDWHDVSCLWVVREAAARTEANRYYEPGEIEGVEAEERTRRDTPTPRRTDHVDVFVVAAAEDEESEGSGTVEVPNEGLTIGNVHAVMRDARARIRTERDHPSHTALLRNVVSSYEILKEQGRVKEEALTIEGVKRTFYDWFRILQLWHTSSPSDRRRIWSGGASVLEEGDGYKITPYDKISFHGVVARPTIRLCFDLLRTHRRGAFLLDALRQCTEGGADYVKVYWYGAVVRDRYMLIPDIGEDLNRLHLAPITSQGG